MNKVLVVVDMQNDFINGTLGTPEAQSIVDKVVEKIKLYQLVGAKVILTRDTHHENYLQTSEGKKLPVKHCIEGTEGWQVHPKIWECVDGYRFEMLNKPSFGSPGIPSMLRGYDEIEFVGVCTDICVISNVLLAKAHFPEKEISVDASCCAGVTPEKHKAALEIMKSCQIEVINE